MIFFIYFTFCNVIQNALFSYYFGAREKMIKKNSNTEAGKKKDKHDNQA